MTTQPEFEIDERALLAVFDVAMDALGAEERQARELAVLAGIEPPAITYVEAVDEPPAEAFCVQPPGGIPESLAGERWLRFDWAGSPLVHVHPSAVVS